MFIKLCSLCNPGISSNSRNTSYSDFPNSIDLDNIQLGKQEFWTIL